MEIVKEEIIHECWEYEIKALDNIDYVITDECLHPETIIKTTNGDVEIQHLEINDEVLTINENTQEYEYKQIIKVHKNILKEKMYKIESEDGTFLKITGNHKIKTYQGWKRIDEITLDDDILDFNYYK
jgi:hypothetical protein